LLLYNIPRGANVPKNVLPKDVVGKLHSNHAPLIRSERLPASESAQVRESERDAEF